MGISYHKKNDYSLIEHSVEAGEENDMYFSSSLSRTFNFLSGQVTTVTRDFIYEPRGSSAGGSASVATQLYVQNFTDLGSLAEVRLMHQKLVELAGNPPPLEEILQDNMGKPRHATFSAPK